MSWPTKAQHEEQLHAIEELVEKLKPLEEAVNVTNVGHENFERIETEITHLRSRTMRAPHLDH